jgi:hypothetical protein
MYNDEEMVMRTDVGDGEEDGWRMEEGRRKNKYVMMRGSRVGIGVIERSQMLR